MLLLATGARNACVDTHDSKYTADCLVDDGESLLWAQPLSGEVFRSSRVRYQFAYVQNKEENVYNYDGWQERDNLEEPEAATTLCE